MIDNSDLESEAFGFTIRKVPRSNERIAQNTRQIKPENRKWTEVTEDGATLPQ